MIFDIGGVLIDWNPRHVYRKLFDGDEAAMEHFLADVCSHDWNLMQDAGRPFAEGVAKAHHVKEVRAIVSRGGNVVREVPEELIIRRAGG